VSVVVELCKQNSTPEMLGLFRKLCSLLVMSGLLFLRSIGGMALELIGKTKEVKGMVSTTSRWPYGASLWKQWRTRSRRSL